MSTDNGTSRTPVMSRWCGARHWFAYYGMPGTSSPTCVRCGAPNPNYRPDEDPKRETS